MQAHLVNYETMATSRNKAGHKADAAARGVDGDTDCVHGDTRGDDIEFVK